MTTCQICGRAIKANTGVIAHHGYKRPGHGWQTRSCFGAHYRAYEVACDALPHAIESVEAFRLLKQTALDKHLAEPPLVLKYYRRDYNSRDRHIFMGDVDRPEDFRPGDTNYRPGSYANLYDNIRRNLASDIRGATEQLDYLRKRLADWKAVAA